MITQIATVSIYAEDQQRSLKFWTDKMGFEVKANINGSKYEKVRNGMLIDCNQLKYDELNSSPLGIYPYSPPLLL
jgi:catechol 2,3-dioxygenase-like lactoylglutathione lyase family enzyme